MLDLRIKPSVTQAVNGRRAINVADTSGVRNELGEYLARLDARSGLSHAAGRIRSAIQDLTISFQPMPEAVACESWHAGTTVMAGARQSWRLVVPSDSNGRRTDRLRRP